MRTTADSESTARRIFAVIRAIPAGSVAAYGEVAERAGMPRRARLVARLLSQHSEADLPWHRVVRADGRIAFPPGSDGFELQCERLRDEGVGIVDGRVMDRERRALSLDEQFWGPSRGS